MSDPLQVDLASLSSLTLAARVAELALRTSLAAPGWALLDLGPANLEPRSFRAGLLALAEALARHYREQFAGRLSFVSISRFDQQNPTRAHRDGGPDASLLLLGYEPSPVPSVLSLLDYTRAAFERGQTPAEFLACCNPAFGPGAEVLAPYATRVRAFTPAHYQIVVVNNSSLPVGEGGPRGMLGVLHQAEVEPRPGLSRVINSVLMGAGETPGELSEEELRAFVEAGRASAA